MLSGVITDHPATTEAHLHQPLDDLLATASAWRSTSKLDGNIDHQELYDYALAVIPPNSSLTLTVNNPTCAYQADAFYGDLIVSFAGGDRYGVRRLDDTDGNGHNYCQAQCPPVPTATPGPSKPDPQLPPGAPPSGRRRQQLIAPITRAPSSRTAPAHPAQKRRRRPCRRQPSFALTFKWKIRPGDRAPARALAHQLPQPAGAERDFEDLQAGCPARLPAPGRRAGRPGSPRPRPRP